MKNEPFITIDFLSAQLEAHCAAVGISLGVSRLVVAAIHEMNAGQPLSIGQVQLSRFLAAALARAPDPEKFLSGVMQEMKTGRLRTAEVIDFAAFQGMLPASAVAISAGCTCPPPVLVGEAEPVFEMDPDCPLHGYPPAL